MTRWVINDRFAIVARSPLLPRKRPDGCTRCVERKTRTWAIGLHLAKRRHGRAHYHQSWIYGLLCGRRPGDHARDSCDPLIEPPEGLRHRQAIWPSPSPSDESRATACGRQLSDQARLSATTPLRRHSDEPRDGVLDTEGR